MHIRVETLARVLARYRESEATLVKSTAAAITVDLWEAMREIEPDIDGLEYWPEMERARKAEREKWAAFVADSLARKENA